MLLFFFNFPDVNETAKFPIGFLFFFFFSFHCNNYSCIGVRRKAAALHLFYLVCKDIKVEFNFKNRTV